MVKQKVCLIWFEMEWPKWEVQTSLISVLMYTYKHSLALFCFYTKVFQIFHVSISVSYLLRNIQNIF